MQPSLLSELSRVELPAEEFVSSLHAYAVKSRAVHHPLLRAIEQGDFPDLRQALKELLSQYYFYSYRFSQYLCSVISRLELAQHRAALMGNLAEEAGNLEPAHEEELRRAGINPDDVRFPHPLLFRRFLVAVGLDADEILRATPDVATQAWIETFQNVCHYSDQAQAVGALGIATEGIVRFMYGCLLRGIQQAWPEMTPRDRVFFDLHAAVDDDHAEVLRKVAVDLARTPSGRMSLMVGTLKSLDARASFFDHMYLRLKRNAGAVTHAA
jgi:pyrroloquinoline-quinone synthase